jgi:hypothetical protein
MKKFMFSAVALVAFSFAGMANEIEEKKVEVKTIKIEKIENSIEDSSIAVEAGSLKCWAFGKWLRHKLNAVSNNDALIDQTVDAAVDLCNILDDSGLI